MTSEVSYTNQLLAFPGNVFSTVCQGVTNTTGAIHQYVVNPTFSAMSTAATATGRAFDYVVIQPTVFVAQKVGEFAVAVEPFVTGFAALGGAGLIAKGAHDFKNPLVLDKTEAKKYMAGGAAILLGAATRAAIPYAISFFTQVEPVKEEPQVIVELPEQPWYHTTAVYALGVGAAGVAASVLSCAACFCCHLRNYWTPIPIIEH